MNIGSVFISIYDEIINNLADEQVKLSPTIRAQITPDIRSVKFDENALKEDDEL